MSEVPLYSLGQRRLLGRGRGVRVEALAHCLHPEGCRVDGIRRHSETERCYPRVNRGGLWEGTTRADDAQGTPTQSHISPRILVYEEWFRAAASSWVGPGGCSRPASILEALGFGVWDLRFGGWDFGFGVGDSRLGARGSVLVWGSATHLQGYLAHNKQHPPRTLQ